MHDMSSEVTVICWASSSAKITSSCHGSDLILWNMHKRDHSGGDFGDPPGPQPLAVTHMSHWIACLILLMLKFHTSGPVVGGQDKS